MTVWSHFLGSLARILAALMVCASVAAGPAMAVQPDEVLSDPALEKRARALSAGLRCLVCQNQSIDDSDAPLAKDLRVLVRERLVAGDSDDAVMSYVVERYGDFVLLKPPVNSHTLLLWLAPLLVLGMALVVVMRAMRRPDPAAAAAAPLSASEEEELNRVLEAARGEDGKAG
jgi:cytochrome c-type biogenesis protein CcmH